MPKKVDNFDKERDEILQKIFTILEINESNNNFSLHQIDNNIDKQNAIINLEPEIKKYFICSKWTCFNKEKDIKRKWLSMIKYISKIQNYNLLATSVSKKNLISSKFERDTVYYFVKNI